MADLSDVEQAMVNFIAATVYPSGTSGPSSVGAPTRVYRGWPDARALDADLANGILNITVFSEKGARRTTRYAHITNPFTIPTPTLAVATDNTAGTVTFGGNSPGVACLAGLRTNAGAWAVQVTAPMTPANVATALAAAVTAAPPPAGITATASGAVVTVSPSTGLLGRLAGVGTSLTEVRRQVQPMRVTFWGPNPALRDTAGGIVDAAFGAIDWLTLADGTGGRITYRASYVDDVPSKDGEWRRDLCYDVEYPTTIAQAATEMLWGGGILTAGNALTTMGDIQPFDGNIFTDENGNVWTDAANNLLGQAPS